MEYKEKVKIAKKLIRNGESDVSETGNSVTLIAFSIEEEERLKDLVVENHYPFMVKMIGLSKSAIKLD